MKISNVLGFVIAVVTLAGQAQAGSAIGVIGRSPLTCKTSLIQDRGTQLVDVQTILSKAGDLYFHIGEEFPKGRGCQLSTVGAMNMKCANDGKDPQLVAAKLMQSGRNVAVAWQFDGVNYRLELGTLEGHPALPRKLWKTVDGVVSNPPDAPFVEIQPAHCSIPPGF